MNPVDLRLCGIIDPERTRGRDPVELVRGAVAGGCTLVEYRDKLSGTRQFVETAHALGAALAGSGVSMLINDRVDVALAVRADGVHLGREDMHPNDARKLLGPRAIIGLTINTPEQADEMVRMQIDYGRLGGIFAALSNQNASEPIGLEGLARIAFRARLASGVPVSACGGIDHTNAGAVVAAGADGVAVIAALFMADEPEQEAHRLRVIVDQTLASRRMDMTAIAVAITGPG
jgi:thiamine-phosphate pyrophosphorylase